MTSASTVVHPYTVVATPDALQALALLLDKNSMVAVDLEADSMYRFKEQVCLVQMATSAGIFIIDPLSLRDLSPLKPFFANPDIQKVFHGADYDVRSLYRDFGIEIANLFDTELACRFLGYPETGLNAVVARRFNVHLEKKYQKRDWSQRPLPEEMLAYAARDVVHLSTLAVDLAAELRRKGRLDWVAEECDLLRQVRSPENGNSPLFLRFRGAGQLSPRQLASLEELLKFRLAVAEKKDRPVFKIISNKSLLGLAKSRPLSLETLGSRQLLSGKQMEMYGNRVVQVLNKVDKLPENQLPCFPRRKTARLGPKAPERIRRLKEWRDAHAAKLKLDPGLIANKQLLTAIAVEKPESPEAMAAIAGVKQWQVQAFGKSITRMLKTVR